jgi:hypothetical protein
MAAAALAGVAVTVVACSSSSAPAHRAGDAGSSASRSARASAGSTASTAASAATPARDPRACPYGLAAIRESARQVAAQDTGRFLLYANLGRTRATKSAYLTIEGAYDRSRRAFSLRITPSINAAQDIYHADPDDIPVTDVRSIGDDAYIRETRPSRPRAPWEHAARSRADRVLFDLVDVAPPDYAAGASGVAAAGGPAVRIEGSAPGPVVCRVHARGSGTADLKRSQPADSIATSLSDVLVRRVVPVDVTLDGHGALVAASFDITSILRVALRKQNGPGARIPRIVETLDVKYVDLGRPVSVRRPTGRVVEIGS